MSLLTKIQTLLNIWFPNKEQDRINFNKWSKEILKYDNGKLLTDTGDVWSPSLTGDTGARYHYQYYEANGEAVGKGFVLNQGFPNTTNWEIKFEFRHDNIRYTGICFLVDMNGTFNGVTGTGNYLWNWEGSWINGEAYANYQKGLIDWFDVAVTKIDSTHIRLQSSKLNRDSIVEVSWLPSATQLSFGARHNTTGSSYGPCRIRNVEVKYGFI